MWIIGNENNACTHMTCRKCQTEWCYVCGLAVDQLDGHPDFMPDNIFGHNENWKRNPKRCPMWLDKVHLIDERWPKDDSDACVVFMHRLRTMRFLKQVIQELGDKDFAAICEKYNVDKNCGFDMTQVMEGDHILIRREVINDEDSGSEGDDIFVFDDDDDDDDEEEGDF